MGKLIVSLSPHAHGTDTVERNMYGVIIALMPALLVSFYFFGLGSVVVTATSVAACVFFEWAISKYILKQERNTIMDGSAILCRSTSSVWVQLSLRQRVWQPAYSSSGLSASIS